MAADSADRSGAGGDSALPAGRGRAAKPSAAGLGVDLAALDWRRSGTADGGLEVAFVTESVAVGGLVQWVLVRVAGDPTERVLVYDRTEWLNFLDGASNGEFNWAAELSLRANSSNVTALLVNRASVPQRGDVAADRATASSPRRRFRQRLTAAG